MAQVWYQDDERRWTPLPADDADVDLSGPAPRSIGRAHTGPEAPTLLVARAPAGDEFVLLSSGGSDVMVNGEPIPGLRVLRDRDEIVVRGRGRLYFSTQARPKREVFGEPASGQAVARCARCRQPIAAGCDVVRCPRPRCRLVYHESAGLGLLCWTYAPACLCGQATAFERDDEWSPELV